MHAKRDNVENVMGNETDEIIEELLQRYQKDLKKKMRGS